MMRNRRGKRVATTVLVMVISIAMLSIGATASASARGTTALTVATASDHTIVVYPNGHNDTRDIQHAFNACVSYGPGCTVELVKGTYYTAQITVYGFQGSFVGAGQGLTVIQARPNLPTPAAAYNTLTTPFWAGAPGPSNPWPDLFTFVDGTFSISGMTITEPYASPITSPGWYWNPDLPAGATATDLYAVVMVTGEDANATFDQVSVTGAGGDLTIPMGTPSTFNLADEIVYEGMFLPTWWTAALGDQWGDQIPLSGTFSVTQSVLNGSISAVWVQNLLDASVTVCYNLINSSPSPGSMDLSNSLLVICGNRITNVAYYTGWGADQSYYKSDLLSSTEYITDNYFGTNWEGSGPSLFDYGPLFYGIPSTLNAVVTGNVVVSNNSCECYTQVVSDVIIDWTLESMVVSQNTIYGGGGGVEVRYSPATVSENTIVGAYIGVVVNTANGTHVIGNVIKDSVQYGIAVTNGSSYNVIALNLVKGSGVYDLYWDQTGTGNMWKWNVCQTSSPPGLCW